MITDYGLENQKTLTPRPYINGSYYWTYGFNYLAVGTGSNEPDPTQTTLTNEVARTSNTGGFTDTHSVTYDNVRNAHVWTANLTRQFQFSTSYNLTEFGFFSGNSGANCMYRQLFRTDPNDPNSDPVVVSVQNGDQLRVRYTVSWVVPLVVLDPISVTINGVQANMKTLLTRTSTASPSSITFMLHPQNLNINYVTVTPDSFYNFGNSNLLGNLSSSLWWSSSSFNMTMSFPSATSALVTITLKSNVAFSNMRTVFFSPDRRTNIVDYGSIAYAFDQPISKTDLQEMTFTFEFTWGRA
ncbi:virion structural protein [Thermus phage P74-26]|uniref:Uncharacterized protein n=1 Tax=Thermus phage P74-26 TaxID=2914007 RepID=A7XXT5_BP742|nr:virion structural protein [Thermus phage P74-26]ABU97054.2 conserved hypothetical protein [Thermus phage P74-26]